MLQCYFWVRPHFTLLAPGIWSSGRLCNCSAWCWLTYNGVCKCFNLAIKSCSWNSVWLTEKLFLVIIMITNIVFYFHSKIVIPAKACSHWSVQIHKHIFNLNGEMTLMHSLSLEKTWNYPPSSFICPLHYHPQNWEMGIKMHKKLRLFTWTLMRGGLSSLV